MDTDYLASEILARKCQKYCDQDDFEYVHMKFRDCTEFVATEDDIPSLIESIKYWSNAKSKKPQKKWTQLDWKIENERHKKEMILIQMLGSLPNWFDKRVIKKVRDKIKSVQHHQTSSPCHK